MDAQYTPGPWQFGIRESGFRTAELATLFQIPTLPTEDGKGQTWAYISADKPCFELTAEEREANGYLMAAAPDLLEAAYTALECLIGCLLPAVGCDDGAAIREATDMLKAALAKAKGP